jgi:sugar O-acyltransferase (sialic acid O-acetyltransferase NeuD family)
MGILILGTGGHAKVALDILLEMKEAVQGFLDDNPATHQKRIHGYPVIGPIHDWRKYGRRLAMGIGSNSAKKTIYHSLGAEPYWVNMIHPDAAISRFATIGMGSMICFGSCVGPDAHIGDLCVVNTGATVDHDCFLGDYSHIAVGAHLSGNVTVGEGAFVGAGSVARQGTNIGEWSTVGAGAVVVKDVPAHVTVVGVPASIMAMRSDPIPS